MNYLKRRKTLQIGSVELSIVLPEAAADRIARSALWSKFLKPGAHWIGERRARAGDQNGALRVHKGSNELGALPSVADDPQAKMIKERIAGMTWYHSIDLGHGVVTPGFVDHRKQLAAYHLPDSLVGLRCLDVATYDGYWAFEMERRGAAEVVALDIERWADSDVPGVIREDVIRVSAYKQTGEGFQLAHEILRSKVRREICNVYDLTPERFGAFDLVFLSDLLIHLRNPQFALERVASVCRGSLLVADVYDPSLERYGDQCLSQFLVDVPSASWWRPNTNTLKMMMTVAGCEPVEELSRFVLNASSAEPVHKVVLLGRVPERHSWKALLDDTGIWKGNQQDHGGLNVKQDGLAKAG